MVAAASLMYFSESCTISEDDLFDMRYTTECYSTEHSSAADCYILLHATVYHCIPLWSTVEHCGALCFRFELH